MDAVGRPYPAADWPKVTWAAPTNRPENLKYIVENFQRQTYPNLELVVALNSDAFDIRDVEAAFGGDPRVKVLSIPEDRTLGDVLNATIDAMTGDYWSKIDDDNVYLENFTLDLILPTQYVDARIIGKHAYFIYLEASDELLLRRPGASHQYTPFCSGSALAVHASLLQEVRFPSETVGEDTIWLKECVEQGERIYSPDIFNYAVVRKADKSRHTWQEVDDALRRGAQFVAHGLDLDAIRA